MTRRPAIASDDWMLEQQVRAEMEAEAWKRLRHELAAPAPVAVDEPAPDYHRSGSAILKALVRFALAAIGAYLAWIAAMDSRLGEFEVWLAVGAGFTLTLALSLLGPARGLVHALAETARWVILAGAGFAGLWLLLQGQG
ncbi:MAG TPA: hypothetical protein VEA80_01610 [Vitreimonas sp.]|uniref:hypothetical protein n=1 Tax=Vitreimonas sp. TaxID=3069702 RepID=UPI002D2EFE70|nr:hypothetical protein [Vitreimonas sp.]HYD86146.1 hypothetical protein [Vitreimonas sp.]